MEETAYRLPVWARRVKKVQIARLYQSCAKGLLDDDLIDDVGYALLSRCRSMLEVTASVYGKPVCHECGSRATLTADDMLKCSSCDWECPHELYKKTHQRKNLFAGGMKAYVEEFVEAFPKARRAGDRLVLIDQLIHRFHWDSMGGRPTACSLIEGRMKGTMEFLDRLSYGDSVPDEVLKTREEWRQKWEQNAWAKEKGQ